MITATLGRTTYELTLQANGIVCLLRTSGDGAQERFYVPKALLDTYVAEEVGRRVTALFRSEGR